MCEWLTLSCFHILRWSDFSFQCNMLKAITLCRICWCWLGLIKTWHSHIPSPPLAADQACGLASRAGPEVSPSQKPTTMKTAHSIPRLSKLEHILVKYAYYLIYLHRNTDLEDCIFRSYSNNLHLTVQCKSQ